MGVYIASRKYQSQTRGTVDLNFLSGVIGEKIKVITEVYFDQVDIASVDNHIRFKPDPSLSGRVYNDDLVYFEDGSFLNNCQVGDSILFHHEFPSPFDETWTLLEIINGGLGRFNTTFTSSALGDTPGEYAANITPLKSLIYQYGLGTGGFNSLVDGSLQKFIINSSSELDIVTITLENVGKKDWQFDETVSVGTTSTDPTQQRLIITHEFVIGPLFLVGQYDDLFNGIAPDYFEPDNKIKYSGQIDYQKNAYNVNEANTLILDSIGQFGWFNTKFNGGISDYAITSLQFTRADLSIANQLEYVPIEVKFRLSSASSSFDSTDTSLVFGFNYLPSDESYYQNTGRDIETNFAFDSKQLIANNIAVNGEKYGTGSQIIKDIKAEVVSSSILEVTVNIEIGADQLPILKQGDLAEYALWCIVENTDLDAELSDKTNVLVDVNYIYVQKTKIDLLDANNVFIEHPYDSSTNGQPTLEMFPVDDVVANTLFTLDYTGIEDDGIIIKSVHPQIVLKHADEADIVLDSQFISTENYPVVGTLPIVQDIAFSENRPYKIEYGIRKTTTFNRAYSYDSGSIKAWELSFPFMNRWEYWIQIAGLNNIPESLFDTSLPFKGINHFWNRLINTSGWTCVYRITFELQQNGEDFEQSFEYELTSTSFNSNTDWSNCEIKSYDLDTNDQVYVSPKNYVYTQKDTLIEAKFTKSTGDIPDILNVAMVIWCESFEGGGITEIRRISSVYDVTALSCFKGIDGSNRVEITKNINTFTGKAILDYTKLPSGQKVSIYARIYEVNNTDIPDGARITNDNILRATNDNFIRIVN